MHVNVLVQGFPGKITRGYMGWSAIVLIDTEETKILFDTGGWGERKELPKRLNDLGLKPTDIDILVLSHFHYDHVINFDYFTNARILMHQKEVEWIHGDDCEWTPKSLFPVVESTGRLELISEDIEIAPGVHTLLSPGHTPGCMALVLNEQGKPTTVVAGDAVKNINELVTGMVDISWSNEESAKSIRRIREIGKVIIPGHDRVLEIDENVVRAITDCDETIFIPKGVAHPSHDTTISLRIGDQNQQNELC